MSDSYPPRTPRKLYRSRTTKMIGGVCGGLADYLNMDPTLVRILTVVISLFTGVPIILYLLALFLVPEEPASGDSYGYPPVAPTPPAENVWGSAGAPWEQSTTSAAPTWTPAPAPGPAPQAPFEPAPWAATTDPVSPAQPGSTSEPVAPSDPAPVEPSDPQPMEPDQPAEPQPIAPSEPEAPVVPLSEAEGNQPKA